MIYSFRFIATAIFLSAGVFPSLALDYPGSAPGKPRCQIEQQTITLENDILSGIWSFAEEKLKPVAIADKITGKQLSLKNTELFTIQLQDGRKFPASALTIKDKPLEKPLEDWDPVRKQMLYGRLITAHLQGDDGNLDMNWQAILRDDSNVIRQKITIQANQKELPIQEIQLVDILAEDLQAAGTVPGSPMVAGNWFLAYEHPGSVVKIVPIDAAGTADQSNPKMKRGTSSLILNTVIKPKNSTTQTSVIGVVPPGQLRRGFLYYLERERAHPYWPFLHYNAWYDICWDKKINEKQCLDVIDIYGKELIEKRKVPLASFVWDDGWDDPKTLWRPIKENFPNDFFAVLSKAQEYHSTLGFWLSPFGGYGKPAEERYKYGREQGFEFNKEKFALAGPKYFDRFLTTCIERIRNGGSNFFKFDGLSRDLPEIEAMLRLTQSLRMAKPDLFISITTGTWPSPFWLWYGDSTWRGADDMNFFGVGSKREQWITYRDKYTYELVVSQAPLYPINSLMTQGIVHAKNGMAGQLGNSREEFQHEVRSFFASGTCLQELYISPDLMSAEFWDVLAEGALWAQKHQDVLVDTHWIGGNPGKSELYGWAAWTQGKGILALRNPGDKVATIPIEIGKALELPKDSPTNYELKSPWKADAATPPIALQVGTPHTFELKPFEVVVYEVMPGK